MVLKLFGIVSVIGRAEKIHPVFINNGMSLAELPLIAGTYIWYSNLSKNVVWGLFLNPIIPSKTVNSQYYDTNHTIKSQ